MVNEDVVLVDNSRVGVYKGDQVDIYTADKMYEVQQMNSAFNGVELHIVLHPQFDLPERFVVSWDSEQCAYSVRHEDPLKVAEISRQVTPSTDGGWSRQTSPSSTTSSNSGIELFEQTYIVDDSPKDVISDKQLSNARRNRRLIEELQRLEIVSVSNSTNGNSTNASTSDFGDDDTPEQPSPQKPILQRRHSIAGHEFQAGTTSPLGQRRRSVVSGMTNSPQHNLMQQLDANMSPKTPQQERTPSVDAHLSLKSSQEKRRPSFGGNDGALLEQPGSQLQRRRSDPSLQIPDKVVRFTTDDAQRRPRRRSVA